MGIENVDAAWRTAAAGIDVGFSVDALRRIATIIRATTL
jgi:hypothetical protein